MEEQQELRLEVQRRTNLVEETQKPNDETTPSTATSFVPRLTTGMMLNVVNNKLFRFEAEHNEFTCHCKMVKSQLLT